MAKTPDPDSGRRKPGESNPTIECACGCGDTFLKYSKRGLPRRYIHGHSARKATEAHYGKV